MKKSRKPNVTSRACVRANTVDLTRSQGRHWLLAVLQRTTAAEVAARCRVVRSCVSEWAAGHKRPSARARGVLERVYGITSCSWDERSGS